MSDIRSGTGSGVSADPPMGDRPDRHFDMTTAVRSFDLQRPRMTDRLRWGPIWGGVVITVSTFLLLQLVLFATDAVSLDINPTSEAGSFGIWSALAAIVAFLIGGLVAGASSHWNRPDDGMLQGIVMWAMSFVAIVILSIFGAGSLFGALGDVSDRISYIVDQAVAAADGFDQTAAVDEARTVAAQAALVLGITVIASAVGGMIGSKMFGAPGARDDDLVIADSRR
jgi:hypothetical protein